MVSRNHCLGRWCPTHASPCTHDFISQISLISMNFFSVRQYMSWSKFHIIKTKIKFWLQKDAQPWINFYWRTSSPFNKTKKHPICQARSQSMCDSIQNNRMGEYINPESEPHWKKVDGSCTWCCILSRQNRSTLADINGTCTNKPMFIAKKSFRYQTLKRTVNSTECKESILLGSPFLNMNMEVTPNKKFHICVSSSNLQIWTSLAIPPREKRQG